MNDFNHHLASALTALQSANPAAAAAAASLALQLQPAAAAALHLLGVAKLQLGEVTQAIEILQRTVAMQADNAEYWLHLGQALGAGQQFAAAKDALATANRLAPGQTTILHALGLALQRLGDLTNAADHLRQALAAQPGEISIRTHLAHVLLELEDSVGAIDHYRGVLAQDAGNAAALTGWSDALLRQGQPAEALRLADRAVDLSPQRWESYYNRGNAHKALGQFAEAIADYERALTQTSDPAMVQWNLAQALLAAGDWQRGWSMFESRRSQPWARQRSFACPQWQGIVVPGTRLLVVAEQGLGDVMQYLRFVPQLAALQMKVVLQAPQALLGLIQDLPGVELCSLEQPAPPTDCWVWIMSLPRLLQISAPELLPQQVPYLPRPALPPLPGLNIGICWQGNAAYAWDRFRSPGIEPFQAIRWPASVRLHCLQRGGLGAFRQLAANRVDRDTDIDSQGLPFAETRALLSQLDLVICPDTSIGHLAGALGVPTWLMLAYSTDYRWAHDQGSSRWYPSVRMFRQPQPGDWGSVVAAIQTCLEQWATSV